MEQFAAFRAVAWLLILATVAAIPFALWFTFLSGQA